MYQCAENAYASLDFEGKGFISKESFMNHHIVKAKLKLSDSEMEDFFKE